MPFPRYQNYNSTNIEWAETIPNHWDLQPIRAIFEERKERNDGPKTDFILSVMKDIGIIPYDQKGNVGNKKSENIENYKVVYPGDLVINKMNAIIGSLGISAYHGALSQVYIVLYPRDAKRNNRSFLGYLFQVKPFQKSLIKISRGIMELRESIEFDEFKKLLLPLPPREEQDRIVAFLDEQTAVIDTAIAKKERLIELLQEQKAVLVNTAVTRGLDPDVPMKESGVEWIGRVPTHWELPRLGLITNRIGDGIHATPNYVDDSNYYFVNGNNLVNGKIEIHQTTRFVDKNEYRKYFISMNDSTVLLSINGTIGNVAFYNNEPVILGKSAAYINCKREINRAFLALYLQSSTAKNYYYLEVTGSTIYNLSLKSLREMPVPLPPLKEQILIIAYANKIENQYRLLIEKTQAIVKRLKEYRQVIIAEAVTGKIKV